MTQLAKVAEEILFAGTPSYRPVRFDAFRLEDGKTYSLGELVATTIAEALNVALATRPLYHKNHLAIEENDERGTRVHIYAIKRKSAPTPVYRDHAYHNEHRLYAAPVCVLNVNALKAAEVFDAIEGKRV